MLTEMLNQERPKVKAGDLVRCDLPGLGTVELITPSGVAAVRMTNGHKVIRLASQLTVAGQVVPGPTFAERSGWRPRS